MLFRRGWHDSIYMLQNHPFAKRSNLKETTNSGLTKTGLYIKNCELLITKQKTGLSY